jgi:hypothetical protein
MQFQNLPDSKKLAKFNLKFNRVSYYSKYNPIERCWGILENHWRATLLNTIETTLEWAKTMTWKGISPVIKLVETAYQKGVRMTKKAFNELGNRIDRDASLPKYYLTIRPQV